MITKDDIDALAKLVNSKTRKREIATAILNALPIENVQGAGHTTLVQRVTAALKPKRKS